MRVEQSPHPGSHLVYYRGDIAIFSLRIDSPVAGRAYLRTNIGNQEVRRTEIIERIETNKAILSRDWHDIEMKQDEPGLFSLRIPLCEVGRFESKAFFIPDGKSTPIWPGGDNIVIKVAPATTRAANSIYSAFVRQFGPNKKSSEEKPKSHAAIHELDEQGYTVIPRSGTFRDLIKELDFITGTLGFKIIQLLPIHPTPTTYARMGRFGSPFAVLDFMDVDPALAEFDRHTTPLDQFRELIDAIHHRHCKLFIDIPINHTGWASSLQVHHPDWFMRNPDNSFQSPGAWGITWEDLSKLNYEQRGLWSYMAEVFCYWCRMGVDGFRCDAGYMVPYPVWEYIVAKVRRQFPDTIFLLEGLGGKISTMESLLSGADLNWAYSELFQEYSLAQVSHHLSYCLNFGSRQGLLVHYAETHDNNRLADKSHTYASMRTALSALSSQNGAFGITAGVEWFAKEKIDVHEARPLNWGNEINQVRAVAVLTSLLDTHPAFHANAEVRLVHQGNNETLALYRTDPEGRCPVVALINLDDNNSRPVAWPADLLGHESLLTDLLSGNQVDCQIENNHMIYNMEPGQALCLERSDTATPVNTDESPAHRRKILNRQELQAAALDLYGYFSSLPLDEAVDIEALVDKFADDPAQFCRDLSANAFVPLTRWQYPNDLGRRVMIPDQHMMLFQARHDFEVRLLNGNRVILQQRALQNADEQFSILVKPLPSTTSPQILTIEWTEYAPGETATRRTGSLLQLPSWKDAIVSNSISGNIAVKNDITGLCTNGTGAMVQAHAAWGRITSQYDALLAANLDPDVPVDRHILFTRCRGWLVHRGYSQAINEDCLVRFSRISNSTIQWDFEVPAGMGKRVSLSVSCTLNPDNQSVLTFQRMKTARDDEMELPVDAEVEIILRPDIEDRGFHNKTKAFSGPEEHWPTTTHPGDRSVRFQPAADRLLQLTISKGKYTHQPEWSYMVAHPFDRQRGLDSSSDLFSPGYFSFQLPQTDPVTLTAHATAGTEPSQGSAHPPAAGNALKSTVGLDEAMREALEAFIVKRDQSRTIIAGYPWFLDWGRDTLIALRGVIAAGLHNEAKDILHQFARFEKNGTIPNMIRGNDDSNRDTSDAPLWFFVACSDLVHATGDNSLLDMDCGGRSLREVLRSLIEGYRKGTPNGIVMDPQSGLIFSPSHFTWMDTNFPAGTPREGYPIEIQALWHAALRFMAAAENDDALQALASQVQQSILDLYQRYPAIGLSDCLLCKPGQSAAEAIADDALRPNQLFAITLGAATDPVICRSMLEACDTLLVPGGIRSLADRPVDVPIPVYRDGQLLNDPKHPFWPNYGGDEDRRRKPAYHNGTAWCWVFPSYCEALVAVYGDSAVDTALGLLASNTVLANQGCLGQVPEIADGGTPHVPRGCSAQAWSVTEIMRIWLQLT